MSRSVRPDYETLRERQARAQESIVTITGTYCDTGTSTAPCKGCPDCMGIPADRHCLEESWTGSQCILNAEHGGLHK